MPLTLAVVVTSASIAAVPGLAGLSGASLGLTMLAIAVIDATTFLIPDTLNLLAFALALADAAFGGVPSGAEAVALSAARGAASGLAFLLLRIVYRRLRGREGLGLGDVKLAAAAGAWLDWPLIPVAIEIAALTALSFYLVRHVVARAPLSPTTRLPFGLFFAPSIWLAWLIGAVLGPA